MEEKAYRDAARRLLLQRNPRYARVDLTLKIATTVLGLLFVLCIALSACTRRGPIIITLPPETLSLVLWTGGTTWAGIIIGHWWWRRAIDRAVRATFSYDDFATIDRELAAKFGRHT